MPKNINIGEVIRIGRAKKKITQQELADRLGINKASLSRYESGFQMPVADTFIGIVRELGIWEDIFPELRQKEQNDQGELKNRVIRLEKKLEMLASN